MEAHAIALNYYGDTVKYAVEQIGNIKKVYGDRLDMHRGELNELSNTIKIIDGVQDEELCFAEDTSNDLGLLYDHLGLTIKTKEKKSGEIIKKVVEKQ